MLDILHGVCFKPLIPKGVNNDNPDKQIMIYECIHCNEIIQIEELSFLRNYYMAHLENASYITFAYEG